MGAPALSGWAVCNGFQNRCSHMALENGCYASRSSAGRMTIGSKCPQSFGSEPNGPRSSSARWLSRLTSTRRELGQFPSVVYFSKLLLCLLQID